MSTIIFDTQELVRELRSSGLVTDARLDTKLTDLKIDLIKWIVGLILGQTALLLTILPKLLGH